MFHLFPIEIFPHFTGRLCHFWHIIQRRSRPVGKPVRQKSPLGRLIFLVLFFLFFFFYFLFFYFLNFISKAHKLYFRNRLNESFSGNVEIFSIFFSFWRKMAKRDKFFKVSTVSILCSYTSIFAKFSANVPSSKVHQMKIW